MRIAVISFLVVVIAMLFWKYLFVTVSTDVMITMRDGVKLATDIYMPIIRAERVPVILIRLPYDKSSYWGGKGAARYFARRGYAVAVQDVRGKYSSEGTFTVSTSEAIDGYDTVSWLAKQSWSNGKIGTFGCSYLGENQIMLAARRHPNHVAIIAQAAGGALGAAKQRYSYFGVFEGGALKLSSAYGWFRGDGSKDKSKGRTSGVDLAKVLQSLPVKDMMSRHKGPNTDWEAFVSHELTDSWWMQLDYIGDRHRFNTPALHVSSWFDLASEALDIFQLMQENAESVRAADNQFIIISPTTHCNSEEATEKTMAGDLDVGDARKDYWGLYSRWFDHWLKDKKNGATDIPKIQYYLMGRNEWRSADQWPPKGVRFVSYYLNSRGQANSSNGDGQLQSTVPENSFVDRFVYDPENPVPSIGGAICCTGNPNDKPGSFDQSSVETRHDVLVYSTQKLKRGIEVVGPLKAVLNVSSSARDTDFTVKLIDMQPDGRAFNVQNGILRSRYRQGFGRKVWMEQGEVYEIEIKMNSTAYFFRPGHRIRIEVSSSSFPGYDRNLNTGGNNYDESNYVIAVNKVYHSEKYRSRIEVPVISRN